MLDLTVLHLLLTTVTTESAPATVSITVTNVNDPPVATGQSCNALNQATASFNSMSHPHRYPDPDGDTLTCSVGNPTHGTLLPLTHLQVR